MDEGRDLGRGRPSDGNNDPLRVLLAIIGLVGAMAVMAANFG